MNENIGGHATVHHHLLQTLTTYHPEVDFDVLAVPPRRGIRRWAGARIPGLAGLDLDFQALRAQLSASAWVHRRLASCVQQYDAVHLYTHNAGLLSGSLLDGVPLVVSLDTTTAHNAWRIPHRSPSRFTPLTVAASRPFENRIFAAANRIVANSKWAARSLRDDYGIDEGRLRMFPFGIVAPPFPGPAPGAQGGELPSIVFVGRQLERKGGHRLLRLHQRHLVGRARLVLITEEPVTPAPDVEVVDDLHPGDDRLWSILRQAALFVFPSTIDQAPNAVIEAMAAGLPVVGVDTAALPEMVQAGVSGSLVAPDASDSELLGAIEGLLDEPDTRARYGAAARCRFGQSYGARVSTATLVALLDEVVRSTPPASVSRR